MGVRRNFLEGVHNLVSYVRWERVAETIKTLKNILKINDVLKNFKNKENIFGKSGEGGVGHIGPNCCKMFEFMKIYFTTFLSFYNRFFFQMLPLLDPGLFPLTVYLL